MESELQLEFYIENAPVAVDLGSRFTRLHPKFTKAPKTVEAQYSACNFMNNQGRRVMCSVMDFKDGEVWYLLPIPVLGTKHTGEGLVKDLPSSPT